ncbi:spore coat protein U domain-containing protein [Idiomarina xiamenensis]|uniref:Spore coat U domain-containing protein n=1 Tax=Idiomarina xiamenensis 10-D-4 TaxID=740709 RepID=K2JFP4_9GAMM|nr:spore coat protein U domain-containing protein [Idiomarina xiamenensis]EKE82116.1 spore coat U domain-containing protein [Idiomarina xiamenensis 10-D-4]
MIRRLRLLGLLLALAVAPMAQAVCVAQPPAAVSLGNQVPSSSVRDGSLNSNGAVFISCSQLISLNLLAPTDLSYTVTASTNNFQLRSSQGYNIPYQLSSQANFAQIIDQVGEGYSSMNSIILSVQIGSGLRIPMYLRTLPTNTPSGTFSDQLTIQFNGSICLIRVGSICTLRENLNNAITLNVQLTVDKTCSLTASTLFDLGEYGLLDNVPALPMNIDINCTRTEGYQLYIDNGTYYDGSWRRLQNAAGNFINYHIYHPQNNTSLDINNPITAVGSGTTQRHQPLIQLAPNQQAAVGVYQDTVLITVSY